MLNPFKANRNLKAIEELVFKRGTTGGLIKRIDENRELLELLQSKAPEIISTHPWIVGWIKANDDFFVQMEQILKVEIENKSRPHKNYPRPWPDRVLFIEDIPVIM